MNRPPGGPGADLRAAIGGPMASALLGAAKHRLYGGDPQSALKDAKEALAMYRNAGDAAGTVDALCTMVSAHVADGDTDQAQQVATAELASRRSAGDKPGEARMLWMAAGVHLVQGEAEAALRLAKEAKALLPGLPGDERKLQAQVLMALANAHLVKGAAGEARSEAAEALELCRAVGDEQGEGEALHLASIMRLMRLLPAAEDPPAALRAARAALQVFRRQNNREGESVALCEVAELRLAESGVGEALAAARQALVLFRSMEHGRGRQVALDLAVQAYRATYNGPAILELVSEELALMRKMGNRRAELPLLRVVTDTHSMMAQNRTALESATKTLVLIRELNVKDAEAGELLAISRLQRILGKEGSALETAEEALQASREAGSSDGQEQARRAISELQVAQGRPEMAPNRAEARVALDDMASAVDGKDSSAFKAAMERLNEVSGFTEEDIQASLAPAIARDRPGVIKFLKQHGEALESGPELLIKEVSKKLLYLNFRVGGLNYGPRFRTCYTNRVDISGGVASACCLKTLSSQEVWGKDLEYHPGILDGMQHALTAFSM